jgi:hypothetical protein
MSEHLDNIQVAAPCSMEWNEMDGDERVRHCALCRKNVYNLSDMSRAEVEALIKEKEGRLCVRFFRRADGTVLTDNCPVGLRAIRRRLRWIGAGVAALLTFAAGIVYAQKSSSAQGVSGATGASTPRLFGWLQRPAPRRSMVVGEMCPLPVAPKPPVPTTAK